MASACKWVGTMRGVAHILRSRAVGVRDLGALRSKDFPFRRNLGGERDGPCEWPW